MINRQKVASRQIEVRRAAAERWLEHAGEIAETAANVAKLGAVAAATPVRRAEYLQREVRKATYRSLGIGLERMIGPTLDFDDTPPTTAAFEAGKPVARIVELVDKTRVGDGFATGFLLSGGLLMTNWHVFEKVGDAAGCGAQFGFQRGENGLIGSGSVFELDPAAYFYSNEELDIAVVAVSSKALIGAASLEDLRYVRLIPVTGKILAGQPVSIIQHPDGGHKRWAVRENKLVREPVDQDLFLEYTTDTLPGSSGSPAFNKDWELVAVHHSGVPRMKGKDFLLKNGKIWQPGMPDSDIDWVANEGARVSKLHTHLADLAKRDQNARTRLASVLASSVDPTLSEGIRAEAALSAGVSGPPATDAASRLQSDSPAPVPGVPIHVVVNGTANFFLAPTPAPKSPVADVDPLVVAAPVAGGAGASPQVAEAKLRFDPKYKERGGYSKTFLDGFVIPVPVAPGGEVLKSGNSQMVLNYHHYSVAMHKDRRLCMWAASNVNYDEATRWRTREEFGTDTWKLDPRIPGENQVEDAELYAPAKRFDRGHIVRRDDVAWGLTEEEEEFGNSDSFHFTNCTPQHEQFNRAMFQFHGLWGELEKHIAKQAGFVQNKLSIFAGPVLADSDPPRDFGFGSDFLVPIQFWKVILAVETTQGGSQLRAYGFLMSQQEAIDTWGWEGRFRAGKFKEQQVPLAKLTAITRVKFPKVAHDADPMAGVVQEMSGRSLTSLSDLRLR